MTQHRDDTSDSEDAANRDGQGARGTGDASESDKSQNSIGEIVRIVIYALLIAVVFRTLLFQPFSIPSGSMKPTLLIGDYLFVSKYSYGYSRFSLPWGSRLPENFLGSRIFSFGSRPERGDVIVFRNPQNTQEDYIKRLIGVPGDRIQVTDGVLYLNDEPVTLDPSDPFVEPYAGSRPDTCLEPLSSLSIGEDCTRNAFVETLPNGVEHFILNDTRGNFRGNNTREFVVPEGHYFFMGDNRQNSVDSRRPRPDGIGMVPEENLVGRAEFILLSSDGAILEFWNWRFDRFFMGIR